MDDNAPAPSMRLISLVTPVFNEEETIRLFLDRARAALSAVLLPEESYEIVFVNDGSRDRTLDILKALAAEDPQIVVVDLSRNFGKEVALTAGLHHASGQTVVPIDVDLQDPPELLGPMIAKWREGYDVVLARREDRSSDTWFKRVTARSFYRMMGRLSDIDIPADVGDFRLMDRRVVDALNQLPERSRFMKGLFAWLGFRQTVLTFKRPPRAAGEAKQRLSPLVRLAVEGLVSFTSFPLRVWSLIGMLAALLALGYGGIVLIRTAAFGIDVPGYASLIVIVLFFSGLNMLSIGVLGEYMARIFVETKNRPIYLVRETINAPTLDVRMPDARVSAVDAGRAIKGSS